MRISRSDPSLATMTPTAASLTITQSLSLPMALSSSFPPGSTIMPRVDTNTHQGSSQLLSSEHKRRRPSRTSDSICVPCGSAYYGYSSDSKWSWQLGMGPLVHRDDGSSQVNLPLYGDLAQAM